MSVLQLYKRRDWVAIGGCAFYVAMMAAGYVYNITFVQLGLVDLGTRVVGMSESAVANALALLALLTCGVALLSGWWMQRRGWGSRFVVKLRLALAVVLTQTVLTALALFITTPAQFVAWIVAASLGMGLGVPATFSLAVDLVPARDRGYIAAGVTAGAYAWAALFGGAWEVERLAAQMLVILVGGAATLAVLAFGNFRLLQRLAWQHRRPEFGVGRYARLDEAGRPRLDRRLLALVGLMFGVFFVDSLGFLRLIATPALVQTAWQAPGWAPRLAIATAHIVAAFIAGILYTEMDPRSVFAWTFGLFALAHLMYIFHVWTGGSQAAALGMPILYAVAVSLYTVLNFAVWPDLSTPRTVSVNAALGVALSGWTASFLSTALALQWRLDGVALDVHLERVAALAGLFFLAVLAALYLEVGWPRQPRRRGA